MVYQLVHVNRRTKDGQTLLHLAVNPTLHTVGGEYYSALPSVTVINVLMECGADVNARDQAGNTPLHKCQFLTPEDVGADIPICLLNGGAHADMAGKDGGNLLGYLRTSGFNLNPVQYLSLKCLCAQVIRKKNLPFKEELPNCLAEFVQLH